MTMVDVLRQQSGDSARPDRDRVHVGRGDRRRHRRRSTSPRFGATFAYTVDGDTLGEINHETWSARLGDRHVSRREHASGHREGRDGQRGLRARRISCRACPRTCGPRRPTGASASCIRTPARSTSRSRRSRCCCVISRRQRARGEGAARCALASATEARVPGVGVAVEVNEQYRNMNEVLKDHPQLIELRARGHAPRGPHADHEADSRRHGRVEADVPRPALPQHLHRRPQLPQQARVQFTARAREDDRDARASRHALRRTVKYDWDDRYRQVRPVPGTSYRRSTFLSKEADGDAGFSDLSYWSYSSYLS